MSNHGARARPRDHEGDLNTAQLLSNYKEASCSHGTLLLLLKVSDKSPNTAHATRLKSACAKVL